MVGIILEDSISAEMRLVLGQGKHQAVVGMPRGGSPPSCSWAPPPPCELGLGGLGTFSHHARGPKTLILNSRHSVLETKPNVHALFQPHVV